jgi:DNA-binding beta-propeller fold protein YncE
MLAIIYALVAIVTVPVPASARSQSSAGELVVVNQFTHTVSLVDLATRKEIGNVSVGVNGHEVTVSPDGRYAYVPIYSNVVVGQPGTNGNHIDVVQLNPFKVVRSIDLGKAVRPHRALFAPNGLLYVTAELDNALYAVDVRKDEVVAKIPSGQPETHMFVISKDGRLAFTANISGGSVSVLDLKKHALVSVIPISKSVQRISLSDDGRWVFVHDQERPRIAVIDTKADKVDGFIALPNVAFSSAPTLDGKWLIALTGSQLQKIDLKSRKVIASFDLPGSGQSLYIDAYASCIGSGKIAGLNLSTWKMEPPIDLTPGVDGVAWAP